MSPAVLRILTFEKLLLTHTCCHRICEEVYQKYARPTPDEAQVIYDVERDDINLLDSLVANFAAKWAGYTRPFVTFMNRVWKPRMRAVCQDRETDQATYQTELIRVGVALEGPYEDEDEASDSGSDPHWPDDYESEGDGWYSTDEEDMEEDMEEDSKGGDHGKTMRGEDIMMPHETKEEEVRQVGVS
jgi:hypothetical protein